MAKQKFKSARFHGDSKFLIAYSNKIIGEYLEMGIRLSLRQLYYRLVGLDIIPNTVASYKKLGNIISKARLAGLVDWDAIEDRTRRPKKASEWSSISDIIESALASYRLPRLDGQFNYVELHCEKDALSSVLEPIARRYHVTLMINRGYSSQSAMYETSCRIQRNMVRYGSEYAIILYLGDLDPSGEDMVRDIKDRMETFRTPVAVKKVALNRDQVDEYNLPPNPAKLTDTRAADFIAEYGYESWEVDAIPPQIIQELVIDELEELLDMNTVASIKEAEEYDKKQIRKYLETLEE